MLAEAAAVLGGGALGGMARFWLADRVGRVGARPSSAGIMAVNISGAGLAGLAAGLATGTGPASIAWHLAVVGFLGSYTTVSSFSLQTLALLHDGRVGRAAADTAVALAGTLGGAGLGWALARWLAGGAA